MPSIWAFGRRWSVSSDDFVFPQVSEGLYRFTWFVILLCTYFIHGPGACDGAANVTNYILGMLLLNCALVVLCFLTAFVSARGILSNPYPRRNLVYLLHIRCPFVLFEILWNILGTVWLTNGVQNCEPHIVWAARISLIGGWGTLVVLIIGLWMVFDPLGHHDHLKLTSNRTKSVWKKRLQCLCCCVMGRADSATSAYEDVADLLTDLFHETDLVASDIWAGLILLASREMQVLSSRRLLSPPSTPPADWMNVEYASRIMKFSLGVYGWPYYVWDTCCKPKGWAELFRKMQMCQDCRCDQVLIIRDNCCMCNTAAFLLQTGVSRGDLFHVSFHNEVYELPYVACADARTESIIVSIRGSLSLRDLVTDLCVGGDSVAFDANHPQISCNQYTVRIHRGILQGARYIYSALESHKVIDDLIVLYPQYKLVICGHSLGAGIAAVLTLMLRPKYPSVRCFAFSPPGGVMSAEILGDSDACICSVVVGDDIIPRLSVESVCKLKEDICEVLEHTNKAKYQILLKGIFKLLCGTSRNYSDDPEAAFVDDGAPPDPSTSVSDPLLATNSPRHSVSSYTEPHSPDEKPKLHLPGRIMHVTKNIHAMDPDSSLPPYTVSWQHRSKFDDIKLGSAMISDHWPHTVAQVLRQAAYITDHNVAEPVQS